MVTFINLGRCHRDTGRRTPSWALSSTQKWTVHGDPRADTAEDFTGRGTQVESSRVRKPGGRLCHGAYGLQFYGNGAGFQVVSGQSSSLCPLWSNSGPSWWHVIYQPRWIPAWGFLGGWQDIFWAGISSLLLASPKFSRLVFFFFFFGSGRTVFLIGTSCCETTQASSH